MPILPEERQKNFPAGRIFYFAGFSIITAFILLSDVLYYHWITASVCCHFHRMHDIKNIENNEDYPMKKLIVNGAEQLYGEVSAGGAKNAAVAIIPATVLARGRCVLENVPDIHDTELLFSMLRAMGATVEKLSRSEEHTSELQSR